MNQAYAGSELEITQHAKNWKNYLVDQIKPHLFGDVIEIGAGLGANTKLLFSASPKIQSWTCLEPDSDLAAKIVKNCDPQIQVIVGALNNIDSDKRYDSALYIDVLEHIEKDRDELQKISSLLNSGGNLIILAPAHQGLFSEFDKKIGHFRRYNKDSLCSIVPPELELVSICYLDSLGLFASLANRFFLKSSDPTVAQIQFWDQILVRTSRFIDPIFKKKIGKSILGVWRKRS